MDAQSIISAVDLMLTNTVAVVMTAATVIVSLLKWQQALSEQTRRVKLESARLAWKLANALHEDPLASNALELLDGEAARVKTRQHGTHNAITNTDLRSALSVDTHDPSERAAAIRYAFDSMFYALDRLRSAKESGLIARKDMSAATIYYCKRLVTTHSFVLAYGARYGYSSTVAFVKALATTDETPLTAL